MEIEHKKFIDVKHLTQTVNYGSRRVSVKILNDICLTIESGEFVSIVGPSGSGKTTLLKCISGLLEPTSGVIEVNGVNPYTLKPNKLAKFRRVNVSYIFQNYNLLESLPVYQNLILQSKVNGKIINLQEVEQLLQSMNFTSKMDEDIENLSGGEKQKIAIARAILADAKILFADEPTGALDSISRQAIMQQLKLFSASGKTVVMVTHDLELAAEADRALVLIDGRIKYEINLPTAGKLLSSFEQEG